MRSRAIKIGVVTVLASAALWGGSGIATAGGGCHAGPTADRGDSVDIAGFCFVSTVLYVKPGTEVTWTNLDSVEHQVVGVAGTWGDPETSLSPGDVVSYRFDDDGVYPYACWFHPGMAGAIVVGNGVGTDLATVVPGSAGNDQGAADEASAPLIEDAADPAMPPWLAASALVFVALVGTFAIVVWNRRKGAVAG